MPIFCSCHLSPTFSWYLMSSNYKIDFKIVPVCRTDASNHDRVRVPSEAALKQTRELGLPVGDVYRITSPQVCARRRRCCRPSSYGRNRRRPWRKCHCRHPRPGGTSREGGNDLAQHEQSLVDVDALSTTLALFKSPVPFRVRRAYGTREREAGGGRATLVLFDESAHKNK